MSGSTPSMGRPIPRAASRPARRRWRRWQLLRTETMTARHLRDDGALGQVLGDDRRPLLRRPLAPTLDARDHLDPPQTRSRRHILGVVTTVNTMVKTMPAHGPVSCPAPTPSKCGAEHRLRSLGEQRLSFHTHSICPKWVGAAFAAALAARPVYLGQLPACCTAQVGSPGPNPEIVLPLRGLLQHALFQ
jgi:hypothetical protein